MIVVLGSVVTRAEDSAEAIALSQQHVARSLAETGCISHAVHRDVENPHCLVFVERWSSKEALWEHFKVPASRAFAKELARLTIGTPSMQLYEATELAVPGRAPA